MPRGALAKDLVLAAFTTMRMLSQDLVHFMVQFARRFAPKSWRERRPKAKKASVFRALRWFINDHPIQAAEDLATSGYRSRLAQELAVALGVVEPEQLSGGPQARAWLNLGELTKALQVAPKGSNLAKKIRSELRVYKPGELLPGEVIAASKNTVSLSQVAAEVNQLHATRLAKSGLAASEGGKNFTDDAQSRRLRVFFVLTNSLPYTQSGYTVRTHAILSELVRQGIEVLAVTRIGYPVTVGLIGNPISRIIDGVQYRRLPAWSLPVELDKRLSAQVSELAEIVKEFKPDILHTTTDLTNGLVTRALAKKFGLPWVYEMRGQLELSWIARRPERFRERAAASERVQLWRAREAELASQADLGVVLSNVQRKDIAARGVDDEKIVLLPNCIDESLLERPSITPADAREKLGLAREGFWVGSLTSVVGYEGLDLLIEAVAGLRSEGLDIRCLIVGDGISRPALISQARQLGLDESVAIFPGRVKAVDAPAWYEALNLFAVPRRDTPVCRVVTPLKPLTALALGRPVLAADLPPLAELGALTPGLFQFHIPQDVEDIKQRLLESYRHQQNCYTAEQASEEAADSMPTDNASSGQKAENSLPVAGQTKQKSLPFARQAPYLWPEQVAGLVERYRAILR